MKKLNFLVGFVCFASGCAGSNLQPVDQGKLTGGPVISNQRITAPVVQMDGKLKPSQNPEIIADVQGGKSKISDVKVEVYPAQIQDEKFKVFKSPYEISMDHKDGATWDLKLSDSDLRKLAVNGQNITYQMRVVAKNDQGIVGQTNDPINLTVNTAPVAN